MQFVPIIAAVFAGENKGTLFTADLAFFHAGVIRMLFDGICIDGHPAMSADAAAAGRSILGLCSVQETQAKQQE